MNSFLVEPLHVKNNAMCEYNFQLLLGESVNHSSASDLKPIWEMHTKILECDENINREDMIKLKRNINQLPKCYRSLTGILVQYTIEPNILLQLSLIIVY